MNNQELLGKKLLVIGGAAMHMKLVNAAHSMGVYVIVTDYLEPEFSPAKQIADESWMLNIFDVDLIVKKCKEERVDGVLAFCIDSTQKPYQEICEKLRVPCYGTKEQFEIFTDKRKFKEFCKENNVGVIPEYSEQDVIEGRVKYPVVVKPAINRGSRGQAVCYNRNEVNRAIKAAKEESNCSTVLIERYMLGAQDMAFAYMVVNGEPFLVKIGDRTLGKPEDNLDRQQMSTVLPSKFTYEYMIKCDPRVKEMIKNMGMKFGAVFIQGFFEDGQEFMYDPGLRFPGSDYDVVMKAVTGFDPMMSFVRFALTGDTTTCYGEIKNAYNYAGGHCLILSLSARQGRIGTLQGIEEVGKNPNVYSYYSRHIVGDCIENRGDVTQRVAEFCSFIPKGESIQSFVEYIYNTVKILDKDGADMVVSKVSINDSDYL